MVKMKEVAVKRPYSHKNIQQRTVSVVDKEPKLKTAHKYFNPFDTLLV